MFCRHLFPCGVMGELIPSFGGRLMSRLDLKVEPKPAEARRIEVITGGRRRRWSDDEKVRAVEASLEPGAVVSAWLPSMGPRRSNCSPGVWRRGAGRKKARSRRASFRS